MYSAISKPALFIQAILIALILFFLAAHFYPAYWNWAIFDIFGQTLTFVIFLLIIALTATVRPLGKLLFNLMANAFMGISNAVNHLPNVLKISLWVIVPAVLLYLLRTGSYILGDGHLILAQAAKGELISTTAFGFSIVVKFLGMVLKISAPEKAAMLVSALSILSGIIYFYFLSKLLKLLIADPKMRILLFMSLATSGLTVLFTGYVETYAILIAWSVVYLYYSMLFMRGEGKLSLLLIVFALGIFWHVWFVAFAPSLLYMLNAHFKLFPNKIIIWLTGTFILVIYLAGQFLNRSKIPLTLPILPSPETNYYLLAPTHLLDFFNQFIIVGSALAILGIVLGLCFREKRDFKESSFLEYTVWPAVAIAFCLDPVLGGMRDWDFLSFFALPLMLLASLRISEKAIEDSRLKYLIIPVLLISLLSTTAFLVNNRHPQSAMERAVRILKADPHYQTGYHNGKRSISFSTILSNEYGRDLDAIEFARRRIDAGMASFDDYLALAKLYYNQKDFENAQHYFGLIPSEYLIWTFIRYSYGKSLYLTNRPEQAITQLKLSLRDSSFLDQLYTLGNCCLNVHQYDSAQKYYGLALRLAPDPIEFQRIAARNFYDARQYAQSLEYFRQVYHLEPNAPSSLLDLGATHHAAGNFDSARYYYERCLDRDSASYGALMGLSYLYYQSADFPEALELLNRAQRFHPQNISVLLRTGLVHSAMGMSGQAISDYRQVLLLKPDQLDARFQLGQELFKIGSLPDAVKLWQEVVKLDSTYAPVYLKLAQGYDKLGSNPSAWSALQTWLRLNAQGRYDSEARPLLIKYDLIK